MIDINDIVGIQATANREEEIFDLLSPITVRMKKKVRYICYNIIVIMKKKRKKRGQIFSSANFTYNDLFCLNVCNLANEMEIIHELLLVLNMPTRNV